jgi:hypothetical protein
MAAAKGSAFWPRGSLKSPNRRRHRSQKPLRHRHFMHIRLLTNQSTQHTFRLIQKGYRKLRSRNLDKSTAIDPRFASYRKRSLFEWGSK